MIGACSFQPVSASCSLPIYTSAAPPCRPGVAQLSPLDLLIFRPSLVFKRGFETSKRDQVVFPVLDIGCQICDTKCTKCFVDNVFCLYSCFLCVSAWAYLFGSLLLSLFVFVSVFECLHRPAGLETLIGLCLYLSVVFGWDLSSVICPCLCQCVSHQCVFVFSSEFVCLHCPAWLRPLICQGRISDNRD